MPQYSISELTILLDMMLGKAGLTHTNKDLSELSMKVNDHCNDHQGKKFRKELRIGDHFYSDLLKKIREGKEEGINAIALSTRNADASANFLHYEDYKAFADSWHIVHSAMPKHDDWDGEVLRLVYHESDLECSIQEKLDRCFPPDQRPEVVHRTYGNDYQSLLNAMEEELATQDRSIFLLPEDGVDDRTIETIKPMLQEVEQRTARLLVLWPELDSINQLSFLMRPLDIIYIHRDFQLAMHLALLDGANPQKKMEPEKPAHTVQVFHAKTVVIGTINIQGTHVSQGDMHITHNYIQPVN